MKKLATVIVAIALIGTPAFAADIARKMPVKAPPPPPPAPVINWTGFYVGGNIGGVLEHASGTSDFTQFSPTIQEFPTNPQNDSFSKAGFLGGVQAGYNWQFAPLWVVGIEGDWDWANPQYSFCRQTDPHSLPCSDNGNGFETIGSKTDWLATLRGRLGVTWGNWLFYGTGGAAWGRVNTDLSLSCLNDGCGSVSNLKLFESSSNGTTASGWVAGLGAEWMLASNWSLRAEWLHIDLGTISDSLPTFGQSGSIQTAVWSRTERFDEFRVGVNYLFR